MNFTFKVAMPYMPDTPSSYGFHNHITFFWITKVNKNVMDRTS